MRQFVIPDCFPDEHKAEVRAMLENPSACVNEPQMILDVIAWACVNGGEGKAMEILTWLTIEFNLCDREYEGFLKHRVKAWLDGEWDTNPDFMTGEDQPSWEFPPQLSEHERWLILHKVGEIFVPMFDQHGQAIDLGEPGLREQGLLDALAWRIHKAGGDIPTAERMEMFDLICAEFPYPHYCAAMIEERPSLGCPTGDWQSVKTDALAWQAYYRTVHYPKVDALHTVLLEYEKVIKRFGATGGDTTILNQYTQYREQWSELTGKRWSDVRELIDLPDIPSPF